MPRIYSAVYLPYTYEDFVTPLQESTKYHHEVEKEYTDSMMVVDALRQRAALEPDAPWSVNLINYANQLENYAGDLMKNGLTGTTPGNLMGMHSGFGKTVTPVIEAIGREKDFQKIRDQHVGDGMLFTRMPTILEFIDNPSILQNAYSLNVIYLRAKEAAKALSERNIQLFGPSEYNDYLYRYGQKLGFSNAEIAAMRKKDPEFNRLFSDIVDEFGFMNDPGLDDQLRFLLLNAIASGALAGFTYKPEYHYGSIPEYAKRSSNPLDGYIPPETSNEYTWLTYTTITPRALKSNNQLRNRLYTDVITGMDNNGNMLIDDTYVNLMYKVLNNKLTFGDLYNIPKKFEWDILTTRPDRKTLRETEQQILSDPNSSFWGASAKALGEIGTRMAVINPDGRDKASTWFKNLAEILGLQEGSTELDIRNAISDYINNPASYTDLADADLQKVLFTTLDNDAAEAIAKHYGKDLNNSWILTQNDDGFYYPTTKEINTSNYKPARQQTVVTGNNAQTVVVWLKNKGASGPEQVITLYWNPEDEILINNLVLTGFENDKLRKSMIDFTLQDFNDVNMSQFNINNLDDKVLQNVTIEGKPVTKNQIYQLLNDKNNSDRSKLNRVELLLQIYGLYYAALQSILNNETSWLYYGINNYTEEEILALNELVKDVRNQIITRYKQLNAFIKDINDRFTDASTESVAASGTSVEVQPIKIK